MTEERGRLHLCNCLIVQRDGDDPLFSAFANGAVQVDLTGYAIVPLEDYDQQCDRVERMAELLLPDFLRPNCSGAAKSARE